MVAGMSYDKVEIGKATLYRGNCLDVFSVLPNIDHVITDPPYESEAHTKARRQLSGGQDKGRTRKIDVLPINFERMSEELRCDVAERTHHINRGWSIVFCQVEAVHKWITAFDGWGKYRRTGVWVKPDGAPQFTGDRPGMGYESIVMHWHGDGKSEWNGGGKHGVYVHTKSDPGYGHGGSQNEHPTKKPQSLMSELVALYTKPYQTVLDPFMGSGSTGVACVNLGREFIGIEMNQEYFDTACERIYQAQRQGRLFE